VRTDGLNLIFIGDPALRSGSPAAMASIKDDYSVATLDAGILDEMTLKSFQDGAPSGLFVSKAHEVVRRYMEPVRQDVHDRSSVCLAALQIGYFVGLIFIDANYKSKHPTTGSETKIESKKSTVLHVRHAPAKF